MVASGLSLLLATARDSQATLLVYEPFNYTAGDDIEAVDTSTATNLTGSYTSALGSVNNHIVNEVGLTYGSLTGLPTPVGNALTTDGGINQVGHTVDVNADVDTSGGTTIFFSVLMTFDDSTNGNRLVRISFVGPEGTLTFGEAVIGIRHIRVRVDTTTAVEANGLDGSFTDGQTFYIIGRYTNSLDPNGDSFEIIGYDTADAEPAPTIFDPNDTNAEFTFGLTGLDVDLTSISSIRFETRGDDNNFADELRISDGAPEPSPIPALGIRGSLLLPLLVVVAGFSVLRRPRAERRLTGGALAI